MSDGKGIWPDNAVMLSRGRVQLPESLVEAKGWNENTWFKFLSTEEGITLIEIAPPAAAEAIRSCFEARLFPLGEGRGLSHNKYVSRWRHSSGETIVNENGQPNIWLSKLFHDRFSLSTPDCEVKVFTPAHPQPGFHSNIASTAGLRGASVVRLRATDPANARALANFVADQLEAF